MLRSAIVLAGLVFSLGGCCFLSAERPVCPGTPARPEVDGKKRPTRPIVWDVRRNGKLVALAYEPDEVDRNWTIVYASGSLPFREDDELVERTDGVTYSASELCAILREHIELEHGELEVFSGFDLNAIVNPMACPAGQ
jgi:hypothetical protein